MSTAPIKQPGVPFVPEENPVVCIFDREIPNSVWNLVSEEFRKKMDKLDRKFWALGEHEIRKKLKPSTMLERLRISFWFEHQSAMLLNTKMKMERIFAGVVARDYFFTYVIEDPQNLAWILTPPVSYTTALHATLNYSLERLREALNIPFVDKKGVWNTKAIDSFLKAFVIIDNRVKGVPVQRIEMKGMHIHKNIDTTLPPTDDMEHIQHRLNQLRKEQRKLERKREEMGVEIDAGGEGELTEAQRSEAEVVMNKYASEPHKNAETTVETVQLESNAEVRQPEINDDTKEN